MWMRRVARWNFTLAKIASAAVLVLFCSLPAVAQNFVKAYLEGIHRTRTDKEFTLKVISKYTREKDSKI